MCVHRYICTVCGHRCAATGARAQAFLPLPIPAGDELLPQEAAHLALLFLPTLVLPAPLHSTSVALGVTCPLCCGSLPFQLSTQLLGSYIPSCASGPWLSGHQTPACAGLGGQRVQSMGLLLASFLEPVSDTQEHVSPLLSPFPPLACSHLPLSAVLKRKFASWAHCFYFKSRPLVELLFLQAELPSVCRAPQPPYPLFMDVYLLSTHFLLLDRLLENISLLFYTQVAK